MNAGNVDVAQLTAFVERTIVQDIQRYGNQYPQFCDSPVAELKLGLEELANNPVHEERYQQFVAPMVFGKQITWAEAYGSFRQVALSILNALPLR